VSRSYRHTPIMGIACGASDKYDKRLANRRLRRRVADALRRGGIFPLMREVSNLTYGVL